MMTVEKKDVAEEEEISYISNPDMKGFPPKRTLNMNDLLANPLESEAEAYIQRSLDEIDPTIPGPSEAQQTILGHVPENTDPDTFVVADADPKLSKPALKRTATVARAHHARTKSTAEDLFQLTADLTGLNKQHGMTGSMVESFNKLESDNGFLTDQDMLIKNAATLIQRNKVAPKDGNSDTSSTTDVHTNNEGSSEKLKSPVKANDLWNVLKTTVQTTQAVKSPSGILKKKDEENQVLSPAQPVVEHDTESDHDDEENDRVHSRTSTELGRSHLMRNSTPRQRLKSRYKDFEDWLKFKKLNIYSYAKFILFFLILPSAGVAAILFYWGANPPCGTRDQCNQAIPTPAPVAIATNTTAGNGADIVNVTKRLFEGASASWWILFVCCRQPVTLSLAFATQAFLIEFLALRTKWAVQLVGPFLTLFVVQSKGWPFVLFWWALYDFALLYGSSKWARHWLFWQVRCAKEMCVACAPSSICNLILYVILLTFRTTSTCSTKAILAANLQANQNTRQS
jgi:hypothetical protein